MLDFAMPREIHVFQTPYIFERGPGGLAPDGGRMVGFGVEWRIQANQIDTGGIHASHYVEVVTRPDRLVCPIRAAHQRESGEAPLNSGCRGVGVSGWQVRR